MGKLHHLVGADLRDAEGTANLGEVVIVGGDPGHAGAGEGDLGGAGELVHQVRVARLVNCREDLQKLVAGLDDVVHGVCVVPEDAEVLGRGPEGRERADHVVGVGDARGVLVLGDAPDALDLRVALDQAPDLVHVGAVRTHLDGDVDDAEGFGDGKVAVVAGARAQELDLALAAPRLAAGDAVDVGVGHQGMHEREARGVAHDDVGGVDAQDLGGQAARGGQAVGTAVVGRVDALVVEARDARELVEKGSRDVDLLGVGLAAGHVELEVAGTQLVRLGLQSGDLVAKLLVAHVDVCVGHWSSSVTPAPCARGWASQASFSSAKSIDPEMPPKAQRGRPSARPHAADSKQAARPPDRGAPARAVRVPWSP